MSRCLGCGKDVDEVCHGDRCRDCHVSVTWDDCVTRTFDARILFEHLVKFSHYRRGEALKVVRETFPRAKLDGF